MFVPGKSPVEVQSEIFDVLFLRELDVVYIDRSAVVFRLVNVTWIDLDPLALVFHILSHF
jgi:hypothetical protein